MYRVKRDLICLFVFYSTSGYLVLSESLVEEAVFSPIFLVVCLYFGIF